MVYRAQSFKKTLMTSYMPHLAHSPTMKNKSTVFWKGKKLKLFLS